VARDLAPPPGGPNATASVVPPGGLRKALRIETCPLTLRWSEGDSNPRSPRLGLRSLRPAAE
jgi:hypothetical protein